MPIVLVALCACATQNKGSVNQLSDAGSDGISILLMPLDVELSLLTAGGVAQPNSEWTASAKEHMTKAIQQLQQERNINMVMFDQGDAVHDSVELDLQRLHSAVGSMILVHDFLGVKLPSKKGQWDWTLGPSARAFGEKYNTDYALFVFVRDSYTSAGRVMLQIAAAMVGVGVQGGQQVGFASLVDLRTGNIVWFNVLARNSGDLRTEEPAFKTTKLLLDKLPQ
ncbi:MAG: hypothetical protein AB7O49_04900 [Sphingomonadales bacterium]